MHVDAITSREAWRDLRRNWDEVFAADPEAHFFLSWEWLDRRIAASRAQLLILCVKKSEQLTEYVGFLPLYMRSKQMRDGRFWQELITAGTPASEFTGLLCRPEEEPRAIPALAHALLERHWGILWLHCFQASQARADLFLGAFSPDEFRIDDVEHLKQTEGHDNWLCPTIRLPDDWDAYLGQISANTRQKLRRFLRKVEADDAYRITHADDATIERDIDILVELWGRRWIDKEGVASAAERAGLREIIKGVYATGNLILPMLWQGDRPLGGLALFIDRKTGTLLFYATGRDLDAKDVPVGLVLHGHSIRHAIEQGFAAYDFLRGDEPYKLSLATGEHRVRNIIVGTKVGGNRGGQLDPMAVPVVFQMVQQAAKAGDLRSAAVGCRQILDVDARHAGARALFDRLVRPQHRTG
jgi:CelD/BcsL family acetyltransferase involved in cellulose biosynthesis